MRRVVQIILRHWRTGWLVACLLLSGMARAESAAPGTHEAALLRASYAELQQQLGKNQFKRPLYLDSAESSGRSRGEVHALIDHPFASVSAALTDPMHWCDVLILHLNTKYCHASANSAGSTLMLSIGKKYYQALDQAHSVEFAYNVAASTPEYFDVRMVAKSGPLGTSDYQIVLEAVSIQPAKTFVHLTYSYSYGLVGRLAMQGYLLTLGRGKVGFTSLGQGPGGQPAYVEGVRGAVERNTMRYYLAIEAYLSALAVAPNLQMESRLRNWFASTEQYPAQLHEIDLDAYLDMKRNEYLRMQRSPQ